VRAHKALCLVPRGLGGPERLFKRTPCLPLFGDEVLTIRNAALRLRGAPAGSLGLGPYGLKLLTQARYGFTLAPQRVLGLVRGEIGVPDLRLQVAHAGLSFGQRAFSLRAGGGFVGQGGLNLLLAAPGRDG
jgi:hypothetical protein